MKNSKEITYKRYKIVLIVAVIAVILLPISNGSVLLYEVNRYNALDNRYDQLDDQHDSLQSQHTGLQSEHNSLKNNYNSLENDHSSLNNKHNNLKSDYSNLQSDYQSLENSYENLLDQYEQYVESIEFRYGDGKDCMQFITPHHSSVISRTRNILGHYSDGDLSWEDMKDIFNWIANNINYQEDILVGDQKDYFFYAYETLNYGYGDCEDQSILMVSLCKAEEDASWIYCASVNYYKPSEGKTVYHIFVVVNVAGDKMYIFDPTHNWHSNSSKYEYDAIIEYENQFGYSDLRVSRIFNDDAYHTFDSNQAFFDFF